MGGSMRQTAVEWLVKELTKNKFITKNGGFTNPLIEQAKEIEKENMINFLKSVFQQDGFDYEKAFEQFKTK